MHDLVALDEDTICKIAAGEVIDRPCSVVKELIENSIDAYSKHISIEVGDGGKEYIRVTDDGIGITSKDVDLAFGRHTTSKIRDIEDLNNLRTLGFRGEALPSIASVSKVEMRTRYKFEDFGSWISLEGGEIKGKSRISHPVGTVVEVRDLFYNVPVRKNELKSKSTELRNIVDVVAKYAILSHIKFKLSHDGKLLLSTPGQMFDNIVGIYGKKLAKDLVEVRHDNGGTKGYISKPSVSRPSKKYIITYVNKRYIRDRKLEDAIKNVYRTLIPKDTYPIAILSIDVDPSTIDVNVHPKKTEIHFYDEKMILDKIRNSILSTLQKTNMQTAIARAASKDKGGRSKIASIQTSFSDFGLFLSEERGEEVEILDAKISHLAQLHDSYIVASSKSGDIILIDQHAAHERINFERLELKMGGEIASQKLFEAHVLESLDITREDMELLNKTGFEIEEFGGNSYIVRSIPSVLIDVIETSEIEKVIEELLECGSIEHVKNSIISTAACKRSIKAGDRLSYEQMKKLVGELKATKMPYTCPHGRPTLMVLDKDELDKRFRRT